MKKILNIVFLSAVVMLFITGCKKTPDLTYLKTLSYPVPLTATANNLTLTTGNDAQEVITFNWSEVDYGIVAPVAYSLQFTLPTDTLGTNAWANAKEYAIGADVVEKIFTGTTLNSFVINDLGLTPDVAADVVVRVKSFVDRPAYSNYVVVKIKPHRVLTASSYNLELSRSNDQSEVVKFNWPKMEFNTAGAVNYTLQFTPASNATGTNAWTNAKDIVIGDDIYEKGILGKEMNNICLDDLALPPGVLTDVAVRIKSVLNSNVIYTNTIIVKIRPHAVTTPSLFVPGDYQGWNPAAAAEIFSVSSDERYEGYVYFPAGGSFEFKMTPQPAWEPTAYGDNTGTSGDIMVANFAGANMKIPGEGYYELTADLNTNKWTATKTTWAIIGDATPGGWGSDTQMSYDAVTGTWKITCNMTAGGSFKFRANNEWKIDFGIDGAGRLQYADNPFYPYNGNLNNLTVPSDGNYTITLDLRDATNYTYILHKN